MISSAARAGTDTPVLLSGSGNDSGVATHTVARFEVRADNVSVICVQWLSRILA